MTLAEIDAALMCMPISPTTPEGIAARADMMLKRFEVEAAARQRAAEIAAAERKKAWGLPPVNVPAGIGCVIITGRTVYADVVDGRRVMKLTAGEVRSLATHNQAWTELNPELLAL
jgi:hypothetical protein